MGPLGLVTEVSFLKVSVLSNVTVEPTDTLACQQNGLDKMFWLEPGPLNAPTTNIIYLCRPKIKFAKIVAG